MTLFIAGFLALAIFGHIAFWVGAVNRWHALGYPRAVIKSVTWVFYLACAVPLAIFACYVLTHWEESGQQFSSEHPIVAGYLVLAALYAGVHLARVAYYALHNERQSGLVMPGPSEVVDMAAGPEGPPARGLRAGLLSRVPGNQIWKLHVRQFEVALPRLPVELDGLSICHWSDLHMSGRIDRGYYREVTRISNALAADFLMLTGDVCDHAECIDWIDETLAAAQARHGKYFILGNHDLRTHDVPRLRAAMHAAGFVDLGGRVAHVMDGRVLLAGDERPWFRPQPSLDEEVASAAACDVRFLLAHSPDRFAWAQTHDFDLVLAGHTHGGQIRFPLVGPVLCPSWHGTRYASGFFRAQPTTMHVSQGTSSLFPARFLCPPEITKLVLRAANFT